MRWRQIKGDQIKEHRSWSLFRGSSPVSTSNKPKRTVRWKYYFEVDGRMTTLLLKILIGQTLLAWFVLKALQGKVLRHQHIASVVQRCIKPSLSSQALQHLVQPKNRVPLTRLRSSAFIWLAVPVQELSVVSVASVSADIIFCMSFLFIISRHAYVCQPVSQLIAHWECYRPAQKLFWNHNLRICSVL